MGRNMWLLRYLICAFFLTVVSAQKFKDTKAECTNCVDDGSSSSNSRWTMPLQKLGTKQYYLGIFFKANWYKAEQYCRFHGMHLASINSAEEQKDLQDHIQAYGMGHEHFWTSGTDQGEEGKFFWMGTGKPVTYQNWNAGEPNNFQYEDCFEFCGLLSKPELKPLSRCKVVFVIWTDMYTLFPYLSRILRSCITNQNTVL